MGSLNRYTLTIGCLLGLSGYGFARLFSATFHQALVLSVWLATVPLYAYHGFIQARKTPKHIFRSLTPLMFTQLILLFVLVTPSFGYALDIKLLLLIATSIVFLVLVWQGPIRLPHWIQYGGTILFIGGGLIIASRTISLCTIMPCQAQTWEEQRRFAEQIALRQGEDVLLDGVFVNVDSQTTYWFSAPPSLRVTFSFTHATAITNPPTTLPYATSFFTINDYDPPNSLSFADGSGWRANAPTQKWQAGLKDIQVSPRQALSISMPVGVQFLTRPPQAGDIQMSLYIGDELPTTVVAASAWKTTFVKLETHQELEIWVDAISGEILEKIVK